MSAAPIPFDNSYARLPERFYAKLAPTPVKRPQLIKVNTELAEDLGIDPDWLASADGVEMIAGNQVAATSEPLAMAYAGHQFGGFSPQLGDGRAILLGEVVGRNGQRRDIQLKGSGPTPFSRRGDGRAALGPVLREYLVSEAMHRLGIPTTRALAAVTTGEYVYREGALPGAVLARVAASHIRVGTFQFFAARGDVDGVRTLADHVIARHYPEASSADNRYRALFQGVVARQASLIAQWLSVGFIHGVMNTDNMTISGETIDYGPCAFMDTFHAATVYSSIDQDGRYAYANQPRMAQWNLARLAETLLPLFSDDEAAAQAEAQILLNAFTDVFNEAFATVMRRKLGLLAVKSGDLALAQDLLKRMEAGRADFTLTFRALATAAKGDDSKARTVFDEPAAFDAWAALWRERLAQEPDHDTGRLADRLRAANPAVIPRNHRIEEVIAAAVENRDFAPFEAMHAILQRPFDDQSSAEKYAGPPRPEEVVRATFCGT
jgi:serine/tyrosine/threonine adenylyltransferase